MPAPAPRLFDLCSAIIIFDLCFALGKTMLSKCKNQTMHTFPSKISWASAAKITISRFG